MNCFVTANGVVGGPPGDADVDGGCTTLRSPVFNLSAAQWASVHYWRWWGEGSPSTDDEFAVDVSSDGGATWVPLERIPDAMTAWGEAAFDLTTMITLTNQVVFRFVACDRTTRRARGGRGGRLLAGGLHPNHHRRAGGVRLGRRSSPWSPAGPTRSPAAPPSLSRWSGRARRGSRSTTPPAGWCDSWSTESVAAGPHVTVWDGRDDRGTRFPRGSTSTGSTPAASTAWRNCSG